MFSLLAIPVICLILCGCTAPETVGTAGNGGAHDGAALYNRYCSSCHGRLSRTDRPGRRAARIRSAIKNNIGGMGYLSGLDDDEINAIAEELALVVPPRDATGEELYGLYCAGCHGSLDKSDIAGKTMDDIMGAASRKVCAASNMKYLGKKDLDKIVDSLARAKGNKGDRG